MSGKRKKALRREFLAQHIVRRHDPDLHPTGGLVTDKRFWRLWKRGEHPLQKQVR